MKLANTRNLILGFLTLLATQASGQTSNLAVFAQTLGITTTDLQRIEQGAVISKRLKEGSDKELAGVVAIFFSEPLRAMYASLLAGEIIRIDPDVRLFQSWKPDQAADRLMAGLELTSNESGEARFFMQATPGLKMNLSRDEIQQFRQQHSLPAVNAELGRMLEKRYGSYRQKGLQGIPAYAREDNATESAGAELELSIAETTSLAREPGYSVALLNFPAASAVRLEHRFFAYKEQVAGRPTFVLSHRAGVLHEQEALMTEQRYYVSHTYDCRFIAGHCFQVPGGTLLLYVNRTFTDQVAGIGTALKHSIGRDRMLADVASDLNHFRDQLQRDEPRRSE